MRPVSRTSLFVVLEFMTQPANKILVIRVLGIGEAVMFGPTLRCLRQSLPDAEIHLFTGRVLVPFFADSGLADRIIDIDEKRLLAKDVFYICKLLYRLRKEKYDMVICAHPSIWYSAFVRLLGVPNTIGFNWNSRGLLYTHRIGPRRVPRPQQFMRLLEPFQFRGDTKVFPFYRKEHLEKVKPYFSDMRETGCSIVGLCPGGAKNPGINFLQKRWPRQHYAELIQLLRGDGARILLFGGPSDREEADELTNNSEGDIYDLTGMLTISETQAAMSLCDIVVAHDSGLLHLAVASATLVFGIYGPTRPQTCYEPRTINVIQHTVDCGPCCAEYPDEYPFRIPDRCQNDLKCMRAIPAKAVHNQIKAHLKQKVAAV